MFNYALLSLRIYNFMKLLFIQKVVQIWPGHMRLVYTEISPVHIWTTLYIFRRCKTRS